MNRRPRRLQRQAPPLRGRAAALASLDQTHFVPLSARPITRQPPAIGGLRPGRRLDQPYASVRSYPKGNDSICQDPSKRFQRLMFILQWIGWRNHWGWFIAVALVIMAIAIGFQR